MLKNLQSQHDWQGRGGGEKVGMQWEEEVSEDEEKAVQRAFWIHFPSTDALEIRK